MSDDTVVDVLSLVIEWPSTCDAQVRTEVAGWTRHQRAEATHWGGAMHLRASDNHDGYVPIEPAHVFELRQRIQGWQGSAEPVTRMAAIPAGLSGI